MRGIVRSMALGLGALICVAGLNIPAQAVMDTLPTTTAPVNPDYESGRKAIAAQDWKAAIDHLNRAASRDPKSADVQNGLGFSWRKSGNLELAFKHYNEALRLDPKHRGAHEYIGEAYLMANNLTKAEEHLAVLDNLCFFGCDEFTDLKKSIENYRRARAK